MRVLGFAPIEDFVGYLGACDIVLNLRYPTVGESSGTLLRALGLGKAVMVSEVGSFQEFPDDVCLKVPVGAGEEDLIFEYLNLLVSRPEVARALGERARDYVAARMQLGRGGRAVRGLPGGGGARARSGAPDAVAAGAAAREAAAAQRRPAIEYLHGWAANDASARATSNTHQTRLVKTLEITPPGGPDDRILEMGAYLQITPALRTKLGYGEVRGCYYGKLGRTDHRTVTSADGETFECEIDHFDAEKDPFPYPDEHFSTVLCCELIEHLFEDPMHLMSEVNRILKPGGHLVLTTPNIAALRGIAAILQGYHPGFFHAYIRPAEGRARWTRATIASTRRARFTSCWRTPASRSRCSRPASSAMSRIPSSAGCCTCWSATGWRPNCAATASTRSAARPGAVRERYPGWLYS